MQNGTTSVLAVFSVVALLVMGLAVVPRSEGVPPASSPPRDVAKTNDEEEEAGAETGSRGSIARPSTSRRILDDTGGDDGLSTARRRSSAGDTDVVPKRPRTASATVASPQVVLISSAPSSPFVTGLVQDAQRRDGIPLVIRLRPDEQWENIVSHTRAFMTELGYIVQNCSRPNKCLPMQKRTDDNEPFWNKEDDTPFTCGATFTVTAKELKELANKALIVYDQTLVQEVRLQNGTTEPDDWKFEEYQQSQSVAVCGPVYSMYDAQGNPQARANRPFYVVSIPGINLDYSNHDKGWFLLKDEKTVKDETALRNQMKQVWRVALLAFKECKVTCPVLSAIGCGAFRGNVKDVPDHWAQALVDVLDDDVVAGAFHVVVLSLPTFGKYMNFDPFLAVFQKQKRQPTAPPVLLTDGHGLVEVAEWVTERFPDEVAGVLNPSDAQAVRQGFIGMYWQGYHIALEELLATRTTLLLQHIDVNPSLWTDDKRHRPLAVTR